MRPAWRLARNTLWQRRSRTGLLVATVALCAALISAIASASASLQAAVRQRLEDTVGAADLRLTAVSGQRFDAGVLGQIDGWEEVLAAVPRSKESVALRHQRTGAAERSIGYGVLPEREAGRRSLRLASGGPITGDDQVLLETRLAQALGAGVGDVLEVEKFGEPVSLRVVGLVEPGPLSALFQQTVLYTNLATMDRIAERRGMIAEVDILLRPGRVGQAEEIAAARAAGLPKGLLLQPSAKITSGLEQNARGNQIGFVFGTVLSFLAAAFIVTTGLTTGVTERTRELSILRCVGGTRWQLAQSQVLLGAVIGALGGVAGAPLGVAGAWLLVVLFPDQLPGGLIVSWLGVSLSLAGAALSGVIGGVWPAVAATRVSPLEGLAARARTTPAWVMWACLLGGAAVAGVQLGVLELPLGNDAAFWAYIVVGVPSLMAGWFMLSAPVTALTTRLSAGAVSRLLGLPPRLLGRTVGQTPYRHGFTAGAMMIGLAMLVSIWTNGRSVLASWLDQLAIPDAFVYGLNMTPETLERVRAQPGVALTCALTVQAMDTDAFGIGGLSRYRTSFIAFEPDAFLAMTRLTWVDGDPEAARAALNAGGAVLVAREFQVARGVRVGDRLRLGTRGVDHEFAVVGVVTSPGLDVVSQFYNVGQGFASQAVNAVFGSRRDLIERFGNDSIDLIQIGLEPGAPAGRAAEVLSAVRRIPGSGILEAGSAAEIKGKIRGFVGGSLLIASVVAVGAMTVSCMAVANLIVAAVQSRRYEFGVLRAVGAQRTLLGRLVLGEALIVGLSACVLGSLMGLQAGYGGVQMYRLVIGLVVRVSPPVGPMLVGCVVVVLITAAAALPTAWRLTLRPPRELLAAVKG